MNKAEMFSLQGQEQDTAAMRAWWKQASLADKLVVFERMNMVYPDVTDEIMSRLALNAFFRCIEEYGVEGERA